jgi:hypothetical protein
MDARKHLEALVGRTIHTIGRDRPNRILRIEGPDVVVSTDESPG